ncbi:caspase-8-like isoform X2 [Dendrobates tinctorius]|uniref:caspase-8-like isoform X2 n=1 Tax=Dendrobates tinctorius TaxID=92724 RepID=UPI003CC968DB
MDTAFRATELKISNALRTEELLSMIFLCGKNLHERDKENITEGVALFSILEKKGLHSKEDLLFLKELLSRIGRIDILKDVLNTTKNEMEELKRSFQHISSYRSMLYDISENIAKAETDNIMHLVEQEINNIRKINGKKCMMVVLSEMEKKGTLSEEDLKTLHAYLKAINRADLCQKIDNFVKEQYNQRKGLDVKFQKMAIQEVSGAEINVGSIQPDTSNGPSLQNNLLETYDMEKIPHGWCIILNNHDFKEARSNKMQVKDRDGTEKDAEAIETVFRSRGYEVIQEKNLTGEKMLKIINNYAKEDHTGRDSFVCFVLSHGDKGIVFGTDGMKVSVKDLTDCFNGQNCPSLFGKPKIFFIQACQGDQSDTGVTYVSDSMELVYVTDANGGRLPITADFLTAFACFKDYESLRDQTAGTVYIQTLCTVLQDNQFLFSQVSLVSSEEFKYRLGDSLSCKVGAFFATKMDLTRILTKVQEKIADKVYKVNKKGQFLNVKQMPTYQSTLRKILILPIPSNGLQAS